MKWMMMLIACMMIAVPFANGAGLLENAVSRPVGAGVLQDGKVICEVPEQRAKGINGVVFDIDLTPYLNSEVTFSVNAKAENLTKSEQSYLGTKFMLVYTTPDGKKHYGEITGYYRNYEKKLQFSHAVEPDAGKAELRFAVQNVSGKLTNDLSTFKVTPKSGK